MQQQPMIPLWNVQVYAQGDLISSDVIEETEVQPMTQHFESKGYEVRSELAWKPVIPDTLAPTPTIADSEQATIREAIGILESRLRTSKAFTSPSDVKQFCQLHIASEKDEYFCCMFLDSQHRLIAFEKLFRGTVDGASVYPRVVVRRALELNAAALIHAQSSFWLTRAQYRGYQNHPAPERGPGPGRCPGTGSRDCWH